MGHARLLRGWFVGQWPRCDMGAKYATHRAWTKKEKKFIQAALVYECFFKHPVIPPRAHVPAVSASRERQVGHEGNRWPRRSPVRVKESSDRMRSGQAERVLIFLYTLLLVCYHSCCYLYRRIVFHFAFFSLFLVGRAPCAGCRNPLGLLKNLASWPPPRKRIRVRTTH